MQEHAPVHFGASTSDLISLADVHGYVPDDLTAGPRGAVWLMRRADEPLLVRATAESLAHMFEVFTLTFQTGEDALTGLRRWRERHSDLLDYLKQLKPEVALPELPSRLQPPGDECRTWETCEVSLLSRRDWLANSFAWPDDYNFNLKNPHLSPGEVPLATEHACWVDVGILFRTPGRTILIASDSAPLQLRITDDRAEIDGYLEDCRETDLKAHVSAVPAHSLPRRS